MPHVLRIALVIGLLVFPLTARAAPDAPSAAKAESTSAGQEGQAKEAGKEEHPKNAENHQDAISRSYPARQVIQQQGPNPEMRKIDMNMQQLNSKMDMILKMQQDQQQMLQQLMMQKSPGGAPQPVPPSVKKHGQ
jgi:hypothetical protein